MPSDKLSKQFFLRKPTEQSGQYAFEELGRLVMDIDSRFLRVNKLLSSISSSSSVDNSEELDSLKSSLILSLSQINTKLTSLENQVAKFDLSLINSLIATVDDIKVRVNRTEEDANRAIYLARSVTLEEAVSTFSHAAWTVIDFEISSDYFLHESFKYTAQIECEANTFPAAIIFGGIFADSANNKIVVRYVNNTDSAAVWPTCKLKVFVTPNDTNQNNSSG